MEKLQASAEAAWRDSVCSSEDDAVKPVIPKEHGAWAVLLVPLFIGAQLGGGFDWSVLLFGLSSLGVFLSYLPAQALLRNAMGGTQDSEKLIVIRRWTTIYLTAAVVFILPVLVVRGRWLLLPIGVAGISCFLVSFLLTRRHSKTVPGDLAAVLGLTLSAPGAYYVACGRLDATALVLWLLSILSFGSCVSYVHMRIRALAAKKVKWNLRDRLMCGGLNPVYHAVMISILLLLVVDRLTPLLALLPFAPITINAVSGTVRLASETDFRKLGLTLLSHSVVFLVLLLVLLR